jgi:DNA-binding GntR family transcriptional regulator
METVAARIYGAIKEQIIDGRYAPGSRITEQNVAAQFNTSRTPVREAMRQLVADGFALFKPNSGTVVRQWSADEVRQIFELRVFIESEIAGYAATQISAAEIAQLGRIQEDIESSGVDTGAANLARIGPLNREFHRAIAHASHNERLVSMLASAIEVPIVQQTFRRYSPQRLARSFGHHRELIDAFSAHDGAWAKSVMSSHIHSAKQALLGEQNP